MFTPCTASLPGKAPPSLTFTLTQASVQRWLAMQQEEGASVSTFSIVSYLPPPTGGFAGGIRVSEKGRQNHTATHLQASATCFVYVRRSVRRRVLRGPYLGMKNRDAASFFLIFLHSVGHLGGEARWALWETRGFLRGGTNQTEGEERVAVKNTDEGQAISHRRSHNYVIACE